MPATGSGIGVTVPYFVEHSAKFLLQVGDFFNKFVVVFFKSFVVEAQLNHLLFFIVDLEVELLLFFKEGLFGPSPDLHHF